mgnify:CR=1 FL=1
MTSLLPLLAQDAAAPAGGGLGMFVPMILIMVMFYFILIRPQRKAQKAQDELRKNLRIGDKVVTIGGAHGIISGLTDKTASVKLAEGLSIKFDRSAIATVVDPKAKDAAEEKTESKA